MSSVTSGNESTPLTEGLEDLGTDAAEADSVREEDDEQSQQSSQRKKHYMIAAAVTLSVILVATIGTLSWHFTRDKDAAVPKDGPKEGVTNTPRPSTNITNTTLPSKAPSSRLPSMSPLNSASPSLRPSITPPTLTTIGNLSKYESYPEQTSTGDLFGTFISYNNDTFLFGAPGDNMVHFGQLETELYTIKKSGVAMGSSGSISGNGKVVAVGVPSQSKILLYNKNLELKKVHNGTDGMGYSIWLNNDGSLIATGAPENSANGTDSGKVIILNGTNTMLEVNGQEGDKAGSTVILTHHNLLIFGSPGKNNNNGSVSMYNITDDGHFIHEIHGVAGSKLGSSMDYYVNDNNEEYFVVCAPEEDNGEGKKNVGMCRTFNLTDMTLGTRTTFNLTDMTLGTRVFGKEKGERIGSSVAIHNNYMAVGSETAKENKGVVYLYKNSDKIASVIGVNNDDRVGSALELNAKPTGEIFLAIGAKGTSNSHGRAYIFELELPQPQPQR